MIQKWKGGLRQLYRVLYVNDRSKVNWSRIMGIGLTSDVSTEASFQTVVDWKFQARSTRTPYIESVWWESHWGENKNKKFSHKVLLNFYRRKFEFDFIPNLFSCFVVKDKLWLEVCIIFVMTHSLVQSQKLDPRMHACYWLRETISSAFRVQQQVINDYIGMCCHL
jgi:hypothetical protein